MQSYRLQDTNSVGQSANSTSGALSAHQEVQKQNAEVSSVYRYIFADYSLARS